MISLTGKPGDKNFQVEFTPRWGYKTGRKTMVREGLYGHYCSTCSNVINVAFFTKKPVDLWPIEESNIISRAKDKFGESLQTVPGNDSKEGTTQYNSTFFDTSNGQVQVLTLKNHILGYQGIVKGDTLKSNFQTGECPCYYAGCFSFNSDLLLKDVFSFWGFRNQNFPEVKKPTLEEFVEAGKDSGFKLIPAYGEAPPVILFPRSKVQEGFNSFYYELNRILRTFSS